MNQFGFVKKRILFFNLPWSMRGRGCVCVNIIIKKKKKTQWLTFRSLSAEKKNRKVSVKGKMIKKEQLRENKI